MSSNLPFDLIGLSADDVQTLENTYKALNEKFRISIPPDIDLHLKNFDTLNTGNDTTLGGLLQVNAASSFYLAFLRIHYSYYALKSVVRTDYYKYQVWAFATMDKDFGRVLIRHETFNDRIVGLIHHCELQFKDDKPFGHKFYVVCNDEQKALLAMNWNFRNAVMDLGDNMVLETAGKTVIIGNGLNVDPRNAVDVAEFASKIAALRTEIK